MTKVTYHSQKGQRHAFLLLVFLQRLQQLPRPTQNHFIVSRFNHRKGHRTGKFVCLVRENLLIAVDQLLGGQKRQFFRFRPELLRGELRHIVDTSQFH